MKNEDCGRCGKCCEVIWLSYSKQQLIDSFGENHKDAKYVVENWNEITFEEFDKINPWWKTQFSEEFLKDRVISKSTFYTCNSFDKENKLCSDHINRPDVCRGFPLYTYQFGVTHKIRKGEVKLIYDYTLYSPDCVFQKIRATKEEWEAVEEIQLTKDFKTGNETVVSI